MTRRGAVARRVFAGGLLGLLIGRLVVRELGDRIDDDAWWPSWAAAAALAVAFAAAPSAVSLTRQRTDGRVAEVEVSVDGGPFSAEPVRCRGCGRTGEVTFWAEIEHAPQGSRRTVDFRARDGASALSSGRGSGLTSDAESPVFKTVSARPGDSTITAVFSKPIACRTVAKSDFRVV